jgi:hypothetical protein
MEKMALVLALVLCLAAPAFAQNAAAHAGAPNKPSRKAACPIDREEEQIALPPCAVFSQGGRLRVIASHVAVLEFNEYGLAPIVVPGAGGWSYVNRRGWVIVQNVAMMDNGANDFHHGLVRVRRDDKWGLADTKGKLVVPLRYDGMFDYAPKVGWVACSGCRKAQDKWGEHHWFEGGQWLRLNARGKVIGPMPAYGS